MNEQRLSDLAILSIERNLTSNVSLDDVVTELSGVDGNRRILLYLILSFTTLLILIN